jgi:hypothetical protein
LHPLENAAFHGARQQPTFLEAEIVGHTNRVNSRTSVLCVALARCWPKA